MMFMANAFVDRFSALFKENMHNYVVFSLLVLLWVCASSTLLWPHETRLQLTLYILGGVLGGAGINAATHAKKELAKIKNGNGKGGAAPVEEKAD